MLGATVQRTRYSNATKRILQDDTVISESGANEIKVISGIHILTNNQVSLFDIKILGKVSDSDAFLQVNLVSSIATALAIAYLEK